MNWNNFFQGIIVGIIATLMCVLIGTIASYNKPPIVVDVQIIESHLSNLEQEVYNIKVRRGEDMEAIAEEINTIKDKCGIE